MDGLDIARIRKDFPVLRREVHGKPLVYLDNAATSQKPQAMFYNTHQVADALAKALRRIAAEAPHPAEAAGSAA